MEKHLLSPMKSLLFFSTSLLLFLASCSSIQMMNRNVAKEINGSATIKQYQVGFALYDLAEKKMIYQKDGAKYFTPASNTKLFTFYGGLKMSPDSISSLRYVEKGDSLIFWGTGDPTFLHTELKGTNAFKLLKNTTKKLFFAPERYTGDFYGNGWQWDDYNAYYQAEINELPLFDNMVRVTSKKDGEMAILPQTFASCFENDTSEKGTANVVRDFNTNHFVVANNKVKAGHNQQIPYRVSTATSVNLLSDTLNKYIGVVKMKMPADAKRIYNLKSDTVFKHMLLPSDNFMAEQLLLTYADQMGTELSTEKVIKHIIQTYLSALPDPPKWVDGSGLSRGNLFTPRDMIKLLELIYEEVNDQERLFSLLPAGGKTGTLRNAYPKTDQPFVFGKTGTLSNQHNQSGYVVTKKGKVLIFSFMNNNFVLPTADVRKEMVRIMTAIHEKF